MLKTRVIPTMLYRDFGLVKGVAFDSLRAVGSAVQAVKVYNLRNVDELMFLDVTATRQGREPDYALIDDLADDCHMPLTVGGGVRTVDHVRRLLEVGADKVAIGTAAVETPDVVGEAAARFGSQCVVAVVDVADRRVASRSGSERHDRDPAELATTLAQSGAGEILLQSVDRDGTMAGYDVDTVAAVSAAVSVPVIASGGAGNFEHMVDALRAGAAAVAAGAIFHFTEQTPAEARDHIGRAGFPVRR